MKENQLTAQISIPVVIPPELAELTKDLSELKVELQKEIELYRANREPFSFTEPELARRFGISSNSLEKIRRAGRISYTRIAGKIHYTRAQIEDFLEAEQTKRS